MMEWDKLKLFEVHFPLVFCSPYYYTPQCDLYSLRLFLHYFDARTGHKWENVMKYDGMG